MSLLSELTELLYTMPSSSGKGSCAGGISIDPALLYVQTGGSTLEASVEEEQGGIGSHHDEDAPLPLQFHHPHASTEASFACIQSAPQCHLPTQDSESEVSTTTFPMTRMQTKVPS